MPGTDPRSVVNYYKYWTDEAILADLDTKRHNFTVVLHNELKDLNLGNIVRSANAFMAEQIILLYRRNYDRRSAIGSYKYSHFKFAPDVPSLKKLLAELAEQKRMGVHVVSIDNNLEAKSLRSYNWPKDKHVVMVFGHEGSGVDQALLDMSDDVVYIEQYGSVRSLNVAVAAGIVMNDYCVKTL